MATPSTVALAEQIDAEYDAMLYDGIPWDQAVWIEDQRRAAHQELTEKLLKKALAGR